MREINKIGLFGIVIVSICAINFLYQELNWLSTIEFATVSLSISYLINLVQLKSKLEEAKKQ